MHRRVRRAIRSLYTNAPYLYTYKRYPELEIPTTTNSCDGYFSHIKTKLRVHSGLTAKHRDKLIEFMLNINFFGNQADISILLNAWFDGIHWWSFYKRLVHLYYPGTSKTPAFQRGFFISSKHYCISSRTLLNKLLAVARVKKLSHSCGDISKSSITI